MENLFNLPAFLYFLSIYFSHSNAISTKFWWLSNSAFRKYFLSLALFLLRDLLAFQFSPWRISEPLSKRFKFEVSNLTTFSFQYWWSGFFHEAQKPSTTHSARSLNRNKLGTSKSLEETSPGNTFFSFLWYLPGRLTIVSNKKGNFNFL